MQFATFESPGDPRPLRREAALRGAAWPCVLLTFALAACGGGGSGAPPPGGPSAPAPSTCEGVEFESTFDAVEKVVFDGYGCRNAGCHGNGTASGGLDLSPGAAWQSLHDVPATVSNDLRIVPGAPVRSVLYQKLAAATLGEAAPGSPMPLGLTPLSENDLNLVRWWIYGGAPAEGVVLDAIPYVNGCLPDPEPLEIKPLDPPAPGEGIQIEMPAWELASGLEVERCFASYFDVCEQVPAELKSTNPNLPGVEFFAFDARELRMDPGSHHLILNYSIVSPDRLDDPSYGGFTCFGGARDRATCDPRDLGSCGEGHCASAIREGFTCSGFGPNIPGVPISQFPIGGAQRAQDFRQYPDGVFNQIPCRGVLLWNPHAFNLTTAEKTVHARLNYYFADPNNLLYGNQGGLVGPIFIANNAPFTKETFCANHTFPRGTRLYEVSSHTHKHAERFWITHPDGTLLYENFVYNDPAETLFDPPLAFDSTEAAERTLRFCATYNNGVNDDGSPNVETVTRASRVPESARQPGSFGTCKPVACVNPGMVGEPCSGEDDDAACDSSPGSGDGECDACHITGGESTENEMFLMIPGYYVVPVE